MIAYGLTMPHRSLVNAAASSSTPVAISEGATPFQQAADSLRGMLPPEFQLLREPPFLVAADIPRERLKELNDLVIRPVCRALKTTYFQIPPTHPLEIILCDSEPTFLKLAEQWGGSVSPGYQGYYERSQHRILLQLTAGTGALAHELTHALAHADCPDLPEWFEEGLASLHEEAQYGADERSLVGLTNWRIHQARQALKETRLPPLSLLMQPDQFRSGDLTLKYAQSRAFALFLQERGKLKASYRELKVTCRDDPTGGRALERVFALPVEEIDHDFRTWLGRPVLTMPSNQ